MLKAAEAEEEREGSKGDGWFDQPSKKKNTKMQTASVGVGAAAAAAAAAVATGAGATADIGNGEEEFVAPKGYGWENDGFKEYDITEDEAVEAIAGVQIVCDEMAEYLPSPPDDLEDLDEVALAAANKRMQKEGFLLK
jgi:hypothetical protein